VGASSFKGIGTTYIGECDYHEDGSYVTTKWFIFLGLPVFPICSHRVLRVVEGDVIIPLFYQSEGYAHVDTTRPHLGEVLRTYSFVAFVILVWVPLMFVASRRVQDGPYGIYLILFTLAAFLLPTLIPLGLRLRAKRHARGRARSGTSEFGPLSSSADDLFGSWAWPHSLSVAPATFLVKIFKRQSLVLAMSLTE
jgi:hypothetical protein